MVVGVEDEVGYVRVPLRVLLLVTGRHGLEDLSVGQFPLVLTAVGMPTPLEALHKMRVARLRDRLLHR
jgi:hypothetical protein